MPQKAASRSVPDFCPHARGRGACGRVDGMETSRGAQDLTGNSGSPNLFCAASLETADVRYRYLRRTGLWSPHRSGPVSCAVDRGFRQRLCRSGGVRWRQYPGGGGHDGPCPCQVAQARTAGDLYPDRLCAGRIGCGIVVRKGPGLAATDRGRPRKPDPGKPGAETRRSDHPQASGLGVFRDLAGGGSDGAGDRQPGDRGMHHKRMRQGQRDRRDGP